MSGFTSQTKSFKTDSIQDLVINRDNIVVQVFPRFERFISCSWLQNVVLLTLGVLKLELEKGSYLGIVIGDDRAVKDLNLRYRGLDEITDVLSFSTIHEGKYYGANSPREESFIDFPNPCGALQPVGEVIISYPQAKRQALKAKIPIHQEVDNLLVHGTLHVFGFDHENNSDLKTMESKQRVILAEIDRIKPTKTTGQTEINFPIGTRGNP